MKRFLTALTLATVVLSFAPVPLVAQTSGRQVASPAAPAAVQAPEGRYVEDAETIRAAFQDVLAKYPRSVGRVLRMDPKLFADETYLASYPAIAQFVAQYPEVTRSPDYYLQQYSLNYEPQYARDPGQQAMDIFRTTIEGIGVFLIIAMISGALIWLIKSLVEHRRWLRVSKIQTEVHTKLLDRFSSSDELLAYMKTPAGSRFLESAPISVEAGAGSPRAVSAPLSRILWSVQAGVVLLLAGGGLIFARHQITVEELKQMFYVMGIFGAFLGLGFILSAGASYVLSQRMGLFDGTGGGAPSSVRPGPVDSAGL
ncbi:MAG TPA: hypothetical protein VFZ36_10855 [Vicinamibacterales bacterium]